MSSSDLNLYVSSNNVDHGPLSLREATERVRSGEFKGNDLAWHQGVSGWMPLKEIPEWAGMQAPPPLEKKEPSNLAKKEVLPDRNEPEDEPMTKKLNASVKKQASRGFEDEGFEEDRAAEKHEGMGAVGKMLVAFAILVFLGTLGVVGFFVYKNLDKFTQ